MRWTWGLSALVFGVLLSSAAVADMISVDENGGSIGIHTGFMQATDPTPGGGFMVLTYSLVAGDTTAGDVPLTDNGVFMDLIRFTSQGTLLFYSLKDESGPDADNDLADQFILNPPLNGSGFPNPQANVVNNGRGFPEQGMEGFDGLADYQPTAGQPGFSASRSAAGSPQIYTFVSDGSVFSPEPSSLVLIGSAIPVAIGVFMRRRRTQRTS